MSDPLYVIPDIHGHAEKLDHALSLIHREAGPKAPIVFLGDYVDRGPDSRGVIQTLINGLDAGNPWIILRGNHEQMMLDALAALPCHPPGQREDFRWLDRDDVGLETLASYGVARNDPSDVILRAIPRSHIDFMQSAHLWYETKHLTLVHAGLRPGIPLQEQKEHDLIWIREPFLSDPRDHGKLVVHGHSPVDWPENHGNRVALDGGAGWGRKLHVAVFEERTCWLLDQNGRHLLAPHTPH